MTETVDGIYIVRAGDTLSKIARSELGSSARVRQIVSLNRHIKNPDRIYEGDFLLLPSRELSPSVASTRVSETALADLKQAQGYFKQMSHTHQEAIRTHGAATGLVIGVLQEIDGREAADHVLVGLSSVRTVAEEVHTQIRTVGKAFMTDLQQLKNSYPQLKLNGSELYREVVSIQEKADQALTLKIGETFRSRLANERFGTKAFRSWVRGKGEMPTEILNRVQNTEKWLKHMEHGATVLVGFGFGLSFYDCMKDFKNGADDLRTCVGSLGGFVGGTFAGAIGAAILGGLTLGGLPLIGGTILVAGASISAASLLKRRAEVFYDLVN